MAELKLTQEKTEKRCSVAVLKQVVQKSEINSIFMYKYRSILGVCVKSLENCNTATLQRIVRLVC